MKTPLIFFAVFIPLLAQSGDADERETPAVEVQTAKVIRTTLRREITAFGGIEPEPGDNGHPAALAQLVPSIPGVITEINGTLGQQVKKGDVLFRLDSRAAEAAIQQATAKVKFATENAARQEKLIAAQATSEKNILIVKQILAEAKSELASAKVTLSLLEIKAPISGVITTFTARMGEATNALTVLAEVVDLDRLVAIVRIPRSNISDVKTGQKASVQTPEKKEATTAAVSFVDSRANPISDTVTARLSIPKGTGLRTGQFVVAEIVVEEKADCLAVPREAVFTDTDGQSTISLVVDGKSKQVAVKVGLLGGNLIEVTGEGIKEGATVITIGSYALPPGTKVRPTTR